MMRKIIFVSLVLLAACSENNSSKNEMNPAAKDTGSAANKATGADTAKTTAADTSKSVASIPDTDSLVVVPQNVEGNLGQVTFTQKKKTIFFFVAAGNKGKIVLNGKDFELTKMTFDPMKGTYQLAGNGVTIDAANCKYAANDGSDCNYGKFADVVISVGAKKLHLKNVELQECP